MFYILCCFLLFDVNQAQRFGPYHNHLVRVEPCKKPTSPVVKDSPIFFTADVYNTSKKNFLLRANLTIVQDVVSKKINIKAYYWEFDKWNPQYMMNNMRCNSVYLPMVFQLTQVKIEPKTCKFLKGTYLFKNLDTNEMQHVWMSTQEYGTILWTAEMFSHAGSMFCWEFETKNVPA